MGHFKDQPVLSVVAHAVLGLEQVAALEEGSKNLLEGPAVPPDRSVKAQVAAGHMTPDQADNRRISLYHFRDWCGPAAVENIDGQKLWNYYLHCLQKVQERHEDPAHKAGWSSTYAGKVFCTARAFVRFLWESGLIELPKNINSKWRFGNGAKAVKTWTPAEVQRVIKEAPRKLKLALLLMVNRGFTQTDVSDLGDDEVDWQAGRITRERSKTGEWENVPVVCNRLWPQTFELLKKYRSGTERVLLTESGLAYVRKELVSGKLVKADNIASNYTHLSHRSTK